MSVIVSESASYVYRKKNIFEIAAIFLVDCADDVALKVCETIASECSERGLQTENLYQEGVSKCRAIKASKLFESQSELKNNYDSFDESMDEIESVATVLEKTLMMRKESKKQVQDNAKIAIDELSSLVSDRLAPVFQNALREAYKIIEQEVDGVLYQSEGIFDDAMQGVLRKLVLEPTVLALSQRLLEGSESVRLAVDEQLLNRLINDLP